MDEVTKTYARTAVISFIICEVVYQVAHTAAASLASKLDAGDRMTLALKVVNVGHAALVGPAAACALLGGVIAGDGGFDPALTAAVHKALAFDAAAAPALVSADQCPLEARISVNLGPIRLLHGPLIISARVLEIWTQKSLASTRTKSC